MSELEVTDAGKYVCPECGWEDNSPTAVTVCAWNDTHDE